MDLIASLCTRIEGLKSGQHRVVVGIDGPDGAGKTTLADLVAQHLDSVGVRASVDGFHNPRQVRMRQGELSPHGYYDDAFDYESLVSRLLRPFQAGDSTVITHTWDWRSETPIEQKPRVVPDDAALVIDGVFLLRPELREFWDLSIYLRVSTTGTMERALVRDIGDLGAAADVRQRYERRYLPAQAMYRSLVDPERSAHVVVDNEDYHKPVVLAWKGSGSSDPL